MAIKLNMAKAYVQVEWSFLYNAMLRMGFNYNWVELIMRYVRIAFFSFLVNKVLKKSHS